MEEKIDIKAKTIKMDTGKGNAIKVTMREFYIVVIVAAVWFIARSHTRAGNISTISVLIITGTVKMPAVVTASVRRT